MCGRGLEGVSEGVTEGVTEGVPKGVANGVYCLFGSPAPSLAYVQNAQTL